MPTIIEMEGYTFNIDGSTVKVRIKNTKSTKEIWRVVPEGGPLWTKVMAKAGVEVKVAEPEADKIIENVDASATGPEAAEPEAEVVKDEALFQESKAVAKRRRKAEREAAKAADEAHGSGDVIASA